MTRALVIESSGNLWGSERALLDLLDGMPEVESAVLCPPGTPLQSELDKRHIRTFPYFVYNLHEKSVWQRFLAAVGVLRACLQFRPDVIYLNQSGSYKIASLAGALLNLPIIAHVRIFEDAVYLAHQNPQPRRLRGIIAISRAIEGEIRRHPQLNSIALRQLYDAYAPSPHSSDASFQPAPNRMACVGRLVPIKAQDILILALIALNRDHSIDCLIAGEGSEAYIRELKKLIPNERVSSSIHWLGFVKDVTSLLRTCSILICPSHREPLGRVIFEAWDAGALPVVYAGSGGAAEIIAASDGGLQYERQTAECLSSSLRIALNMNQKERDRLVSNGRAWLAQNCSPKTYGKTISSILSDASKPQILKRS